MHTTTPREIFTLIGYKQPENSYRYCQARHPGLPTFEEAREVRALLDLLRPAVLVPASRKATREGWARAEATLLARLEQPAPVEPPAPAKEEAAEEEAHALDHLRQITIQGWELVREDRPDAEPLVLDLVVAERLGYERPRKIRELITRMIEEGSLVEVRPTTGHKGYLLTEAQALKVCARSETPAASKVMDEVIAIFVAWRRGTLPAPVPAPAAPVQDLSGLTAVVGQLVQVVTQLATLTTNALKTPAPVLPPASSRHLQGVAPSTAQPVQPSLLPDRHRWYTVEEISRRCCASFGEVWDTYRRAGFRNAERRQSRRGARLVWEIREDAARYIAAQLGGGR